MANYFYYTLEEKQKDLKLYTNNICCTRHIYY